MTDNEKVKLTVCTSDVVIGSRAEDSGSNPARNHLCMSSPLSSPFNTVTIQLKKKL